MDAPSIEALGERLGIALRDPEAVRQAFVHSSYFNENPTLARGHNERLEFYGDAVIGIVVSRLLFDRYPDEDEGFLTARRAAVVNRDALADLALDLGLDRYLLLGRGEADAGGSTRPSLLAACLEALAGVLSLTEGPQRTREVLERIFSERLDELAESEAPHKSAKSRLQEWTQRHHGTKPVYQLVDRSGPPHDQRFRVSVVLDGSSVAEGAGSSRQRAEEQAAAAALAVFDSSGASAAEPTASAP
ncbi:MAG: ribonuclease III [Candidatus Limnocylindria bacterium]